MTVSLFLHKIINILKCSKVAFLSVFLIYFFCGCHACCGCCLQKRLKQSNCYQFIIWAHANKHAHFYDGQINVLIVDWGWRSSGYCKLYQYMFTNVNTLIWNYLIRWRFNYWLHTSKYIKIFRKLIENLLLVWIFM